VAAVRLSKRRDRREHSGNSRRGRVLCNGMSRQSLRSKWPAAKARQGSMSAVTCDREATQAPGHFELNPPGHSSLDEFQSPRGDWQLIPVTQH